MRWPLAQAYFFAMTAALPQRNEATSITAVFSNPSTTPIPSSAPMLNFPIATAKLLTLPESTAVFDIRNLQAPPPASSPTPTNAVIPPIPIYGNDAGLDAAISVGLTDPDPDVRKSASLWAEKYRQTTYYSCELMSGTHSSRCGWHRPIVAVHESATIGWRDRAPGGEVITLGLLVSAVVGWVLS